MELILPFTPKPPAKRLSIKEPLVNPHGILFNPISLSEAIQDYCAGKKYSAKELMHFNELWLSLKHHGRFSGTDKINTLKNINEHIAKAKKQLKESHWLVLTFG